MYLLPGLKRLCGRTLAQILDEDNIVSIWRIAKLFQLTRLEDQCTEYMAKIIEKVAETLPAAFTTCAHKSDCAVSHRYNTFSGCTLVCKKWLPSGPENEQWRSSKACDE